MNKINKLMNFKILLLVFAVLLSLILIFGFPPKFSSEGVVIQGIQKNSAAENAGLKGPSSGAWPVSKETITSINNKKILGIKDYYDLTNNLTINQSVIIETNKGIYSLVVLPEIETYFTGETRLVNITEIINNSNVTKLVEQNITSKKILGVADIGIIIGEVSTTNIRKGLDLSGGTRVILEPEGTVDDELFQKVLESTKQRLNAFGLADIQVRAVESGFLGNNQRFISVEIPGASQKEIIELLTRQGKFEAKIANDTVFSGGDDIRSICRTGDCAHISTCGPGENGEIVCGFRFAITLSETAAKRQADATKNLQVISENNGYQYLSEDIILVLDGNIVDQLKISSDLRGVAATQISISGSGTGTNEGDARENAINNMKQLQILLESGSIPVKLDIVKTDQLSPSLGKEFLANILLILVLVILAVVAVVTVRYKKLSLIIPITINMLSEVIIILGFAAFIKWNIDLAAVAGILVAVGTGVDDQIVILDESFNKGKIKAGTWKDKMKKAFFIIMAAYFTTVVAMLPLLSAGAGLLKGFAITTIIGVSIGVLITRPAFAKIIELLGDQ